MEINSLTMYLFTRLNKLEFVLQGIFIFTFAWTFISHMIKIFSKVDGSTKDSEVLANLISKFSFKSPLFIISIVSGLLWIIIPSQKEFAAIYIIPKVVNNERIQKISNDVLDIGESLINLSNEYIKENLKKVK